MHQNHVMRDENFDCIRLESEDAVIFLTPRFDHERRETREANHPR
jgi:hypothetical protein